jgi:hypothetical protein
MPWGFQLRLCEVREEIDWSEDAFLKIVEGLKLDTGK